MEVTALVCAAAVVILMDEGHYPGTFQQGFDEMCWGHRYHQRLEVQARWWVQWEQTHYECPLRFKRCRKKQREQREKEAKQDIYT